MAPKKVISKKTTTQEDAISAKYKKLDAREHVLTRPGMYIGSIEEDSCDTWVFDNENKKMIKKNIKYIPGMYKIFDEILVNAIDHAVRLKGEKEKGATSINLMKNIKVSFSKDTGIFEVSNDGDGIEIVKHPEHNIYIPELIFGNLMTSTNYDDSEEKIIGGQNGLGSKVCGIFSKWFEIETVDASRKLRYIQKFEDNLAIKNEPQIVKETKKPFTTIRFLPDYEKLNMKNGLTEDTIALITKRVYDTCAVTDGDINIYFQGEKLDFKNFEKYVDLFIGSKDDHTRVYEKINDRWEIVASYNDFNGFEQVSFVNGIWTLRGGKHVEYILNQIVKKLSDLISKKNKNVTVKPQAIKDNIILFVKSTIVNPTFDSQSKETLTTPSSKFGSKAEVSDKFIEKLYKSGIVQRVLEINQIHQAKTLQKTDGKKKITIRGIPKLEDANWAGTSRSGECVLILTEGDSAASMALAGLAEVGRDKYGVFPLKGKIMNVRDTNIQKIADNDELSNLKKILGLESNKEYKDFEGLRYGGIMCMTDSDVDGTHIKSLLFNLFHTLWPSILKSSKFFTSLLTPIVKARKGAEMIPFYSLTDFENWMKDEPQGWTIKYYKGLGTSDAKEAQEYFRDMKLVKYLWNDKASDESMDLAFNKKRADDRKAWLSTYDRQNILDYNAKEVTLEDFINKDLIHFSNYDVERSIPSMVDGLKTSQRKIMYCCFKRGLLDKEIKVAQLASYVSENSAYHHGEASLQSAIVSMAQNFVGANNINVLKPNGQFGTRVHGGKDAGQPRYIFTLLSSITQKLFIKDDFNVLNYLKDDDMLVEPEYYVPIIPMILVNGALGIGTGFSTNIPCYNPRDIIGILMEMLEGANVDGRELVPWYQGFKGDIEKVGGKYQSRGKYTKVSSTKVDITELPVGTWTFDFKCMLEDMLDKYPNEIKGYENNSTHASVKITVQFANAGVLDSYMAVENNGLTKFENDFKLASSKPLGTTNMYAFGPQGAITKYNGPLDIIKSFFDVRLSYYQKRKDYLTSKLKYDLDLLANKIRFIKAVVAETIQVHKMKKADLEKVLENDKYMKHEGTFDYITRIPVYNLTIDKVEELEKEVAKAQERYDTIVGKDIREMWKEELAVLLEAYSKFEKEYLENYGDIGGKSSGKKKLITKTKTT